MALSAKEKTFKTLADNGWVLDPAETITRVIRGGRYGEPAVSEEIQDPKAFTKPAAHGGSWHVRLDYSKRSGWSTSESDSLKEVFVIYKDANGEKVDLGLGGGNYRRDGVAILSNSDRSRWSNKSHLWEALKWKDDESYRSLRDAADLLFKDPDTAVWLGIQAKYEADVRRWLQDEKDYWTRVAKARPLPITIPHGNRSDFSGGSKDYYAKGGWHDLNAKLRSAAAAIDRADGESDLPQLVADASKALQDIIEVLTPEARQALVNVLDRQNQHAMSELVDA